MSAAGVTSLLAASRIGEGVWDVPDGWQQGRGAWGGLVVAALVHAIEVQDPERTIRTVSAQIPAPVPVGTHRLQVRNVRSGSAMSTWQVELGDDGSLARATVLTGLARPTDVDASPWGVARRPEAPNWESVPMAPVGPPIGPVFTQHVEFRIVEGMPYTQQPARALGYVRMREQEPWTPGTLLGLIDAWWPTTYSRLSEPHPMATVSFEAHLLVDPAGVPPDPLLFSSELLAAHEGFTTERRSLWSADGRLIVENLQSIAIIR